MLGAVKYREVPRSGRNGKFLEKLVELGGFHSQLAGFMNLHSGIENLSDPFSGKSRCENHWEEVLIRKLVINAFPLVDNPQCQFG